MKSFLKKVFSRRTGIRLLFLVALCLTLIVLVHLVENVRGRRAWEQYASEAQAKGQKLELAEFIPPAIPDEENYAATPVIRRAFEAARSGTPAPKPFELPEQAQLPKASPEGTTDLVAWRDYFLKVGFLDEASDNPASDILRALERFGPELAELRAARQKPSSRFQVEWDKGFESTLPHLGVLMSATKILALRAKAHLIEGSSEAAYADVSDIFGAYRALLKEPTLICGLVRVNLLVTAQSVVWEGLAKGKWRDEELGKLGGEISKFSMIDDLRFAFGSERACANFQMKRIAQMPPREIARLFQTVTDLSSSRDVRLAGALVWALHPRGWTLQNQLAINRIMDVSERRMDAIERSGMEAGARFNPDSILHEIRSSISKRIYYFMAGTVAPLYTGAESRFLLADAQLKQAAAACALEQFRRATGKYPAVLDELVPAYLPELPRDVPGGAPMRYRLTEGDSYVLWSVGLDGRDNGGKAEPKQSLVKQPDWVWQLPEGRPLAQQPDRP